MYGTTHAVGETFTLSGYTYDSVVGVLEDERGAASTGTSDNQILIPYHVWHNGCPTQQGISTFYVSAVLRQPGHGGRRRPWTAYLEKAFDGYKTRASAPVFSVYNQTEMLSTL